MIMLVRASVVKFFDIIQCVWEFRTPKTVIAAIKGQEEGSEASLT